MTVSATSSPISMPLPAFSVTKLCSIVTRLGTFTSSTLLAMIPGPSFCLTWLARTTISLAFSTMPIPPSLLPATTFSSIT